MSIEYGYRKVCPTGSFYALGKAPKEGYLSVVRIVCTLVTVSIISSWYGRASIERMLLLFLHWFGGLLHLTCGLVMAQMILNCWIGEEFEPFIKAITFLQLTASNLVAITNLAICVNLALIVHRHRTMSRWKSVSSFRTVFVLLSVSAGFAVPLQFFQAGWTVTATGFHASAATEDQRWISVSKIIFEAVASFGMTIIVGQLLLFRRSELIEVWRVNRRIKFHVALTAIALFVDLFVTIAGLLLLVHHGPTWVIVLAWVFRYVHIALDTLVLYSALETPEFHMGRSFQEPW